MTTTLTAMATLVAVPFLIGVLLAVGLEFSMGRISCGRCALDRIVQCDGFVSSSR
jgi:hypothetical protein